MKIFRHTASKNIIITTKWCKKDETSIVFSLVASHSTDNIPLNEKKLFETVSFPC